MTAQSSAVAAGISRNTPRTSCGGPKMFDIARRCSSVALIASSVSRRSRSSRAHRRSSPSAKPPAGRRCARRHPAAPASPAQVVQGLRSPAGDRSGSRSWPTGRPSMVAISGSSSASCCTKVSAQVANRPTRSGASVASCHAGHSARCHAPPGAADAGTLGSAGDQSQDFGNGVVPGHRPGRRGGVRGRPATRSRSITGTRPDLAAEVLAGLPGDGHVVVQADIADPRRGPRPWWTAPPTSSAAWTCW